MAHRNHIEIARRTIERLPSFRDTERMAQEVLDNFLTTISVDIRDLLQEAHNMPLMDELDAKYWQGRIDALRAVQRVLGVDE